MAVNTDEIFVGGPDRVAGAIMSAPSGTALPASLAASLSGYNDAGYVDATGLAVMQAGTWNSVTDWGGDVVRRFLTTFVSTLTFTYVELNPVSAGVFFGPTNVTTRSATSTTGVQMDIAVNGLECPKQSFVFNLKDGATKKARIVVPLGQPTDRGQVNFTRTGAVSLPVTIQTYPDSLGNLIWIYTEDGVYTGTAVPTILSALPTAVAVGGMVSIRGSKFTGTTGAAGVKFGATNATSYVVEDDGLIVAVMPAGSAGPANIVVTNGAGPSAAYSYTRGA